MTWHENRKKVLGVILFMKILDSSSTVFPYLYSETKNVGMTLHIIHTW